MKYLPLTAITVKYLSSTPDNYNSTAMSFSAPVRKLNIIIVIEINVIIIYKCFPNVTGYACAYAYASMIKSGTEGTYGPEGVA